MSKTSISILQEYIVQRKEALPIYCIENCNYELGGFKCTVNVSSVTAVGYACTKKEAKQNSAKRALEILGKRSNFSQQNTSVLVDTSVKQTCFVNFVGKLNELASTNGKPYPVYYAEPMPDTNGMLMTQCRFLDFISEGYGLKKKDSKQNAARTMLDKLQDKDISLITVAIQNLHMEKKGNLESLSQEVLKNYDKLNATVVNISPLSKTIPSTKYLKKNVCSLEDFRGMLRSYGYNYTIETFQTDPYIMMMKINGTNVTIMGNGENKQQALNDLYENVILMFDHGFSWTTNI